MSADTEHVLVGKLREQLAEGKIERREFMRFAVLLGLSVGAAAATSGTPPARAEGTLPFADDPKAKKGGTLRVGQAVAKMEDPATYSWNEMSNQTRPVLEYMTVVGPDNLVRPMLVKSWDASPDLKQWTLHVRKGVLWHNGDELTADHLAFNLVRWTDSTLGSSNSGLSTFGALAEDTGVKNAKGKPMLRPRTGAVEVLDRYTLRLNLSKPVLSVAEDCAEYPTAIVHPSFKPPLAENPIGTGPFTIAELKVGDRCILKRVTKTRDGKDFKYWGGDVYLDEIHFYNFEHENQVTALASSSVDLIYEISVEELQLARAIPGGQILSVPSANTLCCRMQVDKRPFDDIRVRQAIVKAADNGAILDLIFPDGGAVAENHHVAPIHPEYVELPKLKRDVEGARKLLAEAGHGSGLDLTIDVGNTDGPWHQTVCEALRDQLKEVGINLAINVLPTQKFWEIWDKTVFGATSWGHRPLGTMVLSQAYRSGVPWNETHFSDPQFDATLAEAEGLIDVAKRKEKMKELETILQDAAIMVQPIWRPVYTMASKDVRGYRAQPARVMHLTKVWIG